MNGRSASEGTDSRNPIFSALANDRRRRVLEVLLDRASAVDEEDLSVHVTAIEGETSLLDVTDEEVRSIGVDLAHVQLPTLEEAGLVDRDTETQTVTTTDHPVLLDPTFQRIVQTEAEGWGEVLVNLAYRRRRIALSVLDGREVPMASADLARSIVARETDGETDLDPESAAALNVVLHHVHLPKLEQAGLLAYDTDAGTVSYAGHPALDAEWLDSGPDEEPPCGGTVLARGGERLDDRGPR